MEWKNLWVGNLGSDVSESDLRQVFSEYGAVESVSAYSSRRYAFVLFRRPQDAAAAKLALHGFPLGGSPLSIQFARPAKPSPRLWVGGLAPSLDKDLLEKQFLPFGHIVDLTLLRDRNTAFLEFSLLQDASAAAAAMNGKRLHGHPIRVDFLRSQPQEPQPPPQPQPQPPSSNVLCIGYPQSFPIDDQMLHNAMILFGEILSIKSFPSSNYSLVEFTTVDEARRAKEGLQGRLFNDSRITIAISSPSPERHAKRPRIDQASPFFSQPFGNLQVRPKQLKPDNDFIWRGTIAKGGTPVCSARCVPIGAWLGSDLPEVVNCSARTGLDMLTKHYAEAIGFEVVFFLPDSEDDFASYTEFLRYLGAKDRAGVAKFDDGTTLFLVPPSDFLTKVLKVAGPERLYGVVLKFPQSLPITPQYPDRPQLPVFPSKDQQFDYGRAFPEIPPETSSEYAYRNPGHGIALTPELISTLSSSHLPSNPSPSPSHGWRQDYHQQQSYLPPPPPQQAAGFYNNAPPQQPHMNTSSQSSEVSKQSEGTAEVDKNQRYQSTLQFAANLLLQIQHQAPGHNKQ